MSATLTCSQPDCPAPAGGVCALGHANPVDCPQATVPSADAPEPAAAVPTATAEPGPPGDDELLPPAPTPGVLLHPGVALSVAQANVLASDAGVRVVLPVGSVGTGKTTLAVGLYERFLARSWGGASYLWSETLLDFEMLAFPGRLASGAGIPSTWRTRLRDSAGHLLHLRVSCESSPRLDLVFANLPGELSDHIRDGEAPASEIPLLASADRLVMCVDGAKIASPGHHGLAVSHTRQFLRTLKQGSGVPPTCAVSLVLTKFDLVSDTPGGVERWEAARAALEPELAGLGRPGIVVCTAARAKTSGFAPDGMDVLLQWLTSPDGLADPALPDPRVAGPRAADRFTGQTP